MWIGGDDKTADLLFQLMHWNSQSVYSCSTIRSGFKYCWYWIFYKYNTKFKRNKKVEIFNKKKRNISKINYNQIIKSRSWLLNQLKCFVKFIVYYLVNFDKFLTNEQRFNNLKWTFIILLAAISSFYFFRFFVYIFYS